MILIRTIAAILTLNALLCVQVNAQQSDNEDGTYTNPIIWSDFPDPDVIRVGDTFYMVNTTMYVFPGVPVMKSKDLVNWEYAANVVPRFDQHPAYNLEEGNRYGHGQWASSIRYHNGLFHILFLTLDEGGYLYTAVKAEGPWTMHKLPKAYYDAGLFYDDNGKVYVVGGNTNIAITEVDENLAPLKKDSIVFTKNQAQRPGLEGSHLYKINGWYYIYATYGGPDGYQVCLRARNIYGPYEEKIVLKDDMNAAGFGVHQGALVETQNGEWWSVIFQDRGGVGRVPTLQPVTWVDDWPIVGKNGRAVVTYKKPNVGKDFPVKVLPTNDEFAGGRLGMQWSWNHNPDDSCWSLNERKGFLRLKTAKVVNDLPNARNTLTQRTFGPYSNGTISMDIQHMRYGDVAGLGVLQVPHAYIGVRMGKKENLIVMVNAGKTVDSTSIGSRKNLYFKAKVSTTKDEAIFYYSVDNKNFIALGDTLHMKFNLKMFTGNKFAIFNFATIETGGFVDVDWFRMETRQGPPNLFSAGSTIEAEFYDEIFLARTGNSRDAAARKDLDITNTISGSWIKFNQVDFAAGFTQLSVRISSQNKPGRINVFLDNDLKTPYVSIPVQATDGSNTYKTVTVPVKTVTGKHALTFKFESEGGETGDINWFSFL